MTAPKLFIENDEDGRILAEAEFRGYLKAFVELESSTRIPVCFYEPFRLSQDLQAEIELGRPYIAEHGIIVVKEVTPCVLNKTISDLHRIGYFNE